VTEYKHAAETEIIPATVQNQLESLAVLNPLERSDWDNLVAQRQDSSFFHTVAWARVLWETYGYLPLYFTVIKDNRLLALLPVMEVESWLTGRRGVSLPFTDACEPLGSGSLLNERLIPQVLHYGEESAWKYFECRGGEGLFKSNTASQSFYSHELRLFPDEDYLFGRLGSAPRRAIRKAQKSGVIVETSRDLEAVRQFYSVHCLTRKKHGLPPQPFRFFKNIHEHILSQGKGVVILARHGKNILGGAVYFSFSSEVFYKYGASDPTFQELRGNNLVMWKAIQWSLRQGAKTLHFGRTSTANQGLRRFKLGWGAEERLVSYYKYDFRKQTFVRDSDKTCGWHVGAFQNLPIFLSRGIGSILYRHIG
jgi:GNAT acetyltransferase-like protein